LISDSQKPAQAKIRGKHNPTGKRRAMFTPRNTKAQRKELRAMQKLQSTLRRVDASLGSQGTGREQNSQDSEEKEGNSQDSLRSLDVPDPAGSFVHLSAQEIRAMQGANLLQLITKDRGNTFLKKLETTLKDGVPRNLRDALDLAGKIPLTIKMLSQNVSSSDLLIDFSQAGGVFAKSDGFYRPTKAFLEIKGAKVKSGTKNQFQMKKIRHQGTQWTHLIFVCRTQQPRCWTDSDDLDRCGLWFGVVSRQKYTAALLKAPNGLYNRKEVTVTVTPGNGLASGGKPAKSWLGDSIKWTRSQDMTAQWLSDVFERH